MGILATTLIPPARMALGYSDMLLKDVRGEDFARMPKGVVTNSPAFCYGHLAIYPDRFLELLGRGDVARSDASYLEHFAAGKECKDDPTGTIYPPMEAIVARFRQRHEAALAILAETTDEELMKPNPNEQGRARLPTMGAVAAFYFGAHIMMHMGQVSAWRRVMGLSAAMS